MTDSLLGNYTEKANFWKLYSTFKVPKIYKEFYNSDKSKNKTTSSNIMWALTFIFDKSIDNPYKTLQIEDKIEVINEDILNNVNFSWEEYKEIKDFTKKIFMTEIERTYYSFMEKIEERRKLIETSVYTLETAISIDKMIKDTESVRKEIDNLKKLVEQQEADGKTKGDITLSAGEKGEI